MPIVRVVRGKDQQVFPAERGEALSAVLLQTGIPFHAPCGGQRSCHKCKLRITGAVSPLSRTEAEFLTDDELLAGTRLACFACVAGDCTVFLSEEAAQAVQTDFAGTTSVSGSSLTGYGLAVDLGTTTIAAYLCDRATGKVLSVCSALNPQRVFGDDVISRISACSLPDGRQQLFAAVSDCLSGLTRSLCKKASVACEEITGCTIVGNTVMLHLLTLLDPTSIAAAPFTPLSLFSTRHSAQSLGLPLACDCYLAPCVSGYVGGDITAGMVACGLDESEEPLLLIDVGTNGELALSCGGDILCCSVAAGPAFEGARISCGCGGIPGAIDDVRAENGQIHFSTIDGVLPPTGLCGSGLIAAADAALSVGAAEDSGYMKSDFPLSGESGLFLTPHDLRELQLAKSAVCAGIYRLTEEAGIPVSALHRVLLAGGFGSHLSPEKAARIGLFPFELHDRCRAVGNAAGKGAILSLTSAQAAARLEAIPNLCRYLELSGDARFNELYIDKLPFDYYEQENDE